jgi:hypothetical protein
LDLEATEKAIRAAMHEAGGQMLEMLVGGDTGYRGREIDCGKGHRASFVANRMKQVVTVLSPIAVERAYYYCDKCRGGFVPKDDQLDISGTSFSPGVRRMMGHVGGKDAFNGGRQDLEELAGVVVKTKEVERISEAIGEQVANFFERERELILAGKVAPIETAGKMYIAIDGTGIPMVTCEVEGRKGKDRSGKARTREAKLGCVFTQTRLDEKGYAVRDEDSTSYVAAIEDAKAFGWRIYAEGLRRGLDRAKKVIVIGDGAPWIWGIADLHFHDAVKIVDLYHARQHIANLSKILYGAESTKSREWTSIRCAELDLGEVEAVVRSLRRARPRTNEAKDEVRKGIEYFEANASRMRYEQFRSEGLFVGSGVVEAGCKMIGQRLKRSGMHWGLRGANAILALRCCQMSGRWGEFWEARASA